MFAWNNSKDSLLWIIWNDCKQTIWFLDYHVNFERSSFSLLFANQSCTYFEMISFWNCIQKKDQLWKWKQTLQSWKHRRGHSLFKGDCKLSWYDILFRCQHLPLKCTTHLHILHSCSKCLFPKYENRRNDQDMMVVQKYWANYQRVRLHFFESK